MTEVATVANQLLARLPERDFGLLSRRMERVTVPLRAVVCEPGEPMEFAHFPLTCVLSSIVVMSDGAAVEAATIGNEGMAGVALMLNERASPYRVIGQVEGESLRVPADDFREALRESAPLQELVRRYVLALLHQVARNCACNLHHAVEERMCRWLLACADRAERDEFYITQEFLSEMLGVRRQSVNLTAGALQQSGLITYRRGNMRILDRPRLEESACECYRTNRETYERMMQLPAR